MSTRFLTRRIVNLSTISATSEAASAPVSNLFHPQPNYCWVAPDPAGAAFVIDTGGAATFDALEIEGYDTIFWGYALRSEAGPAGTVTVSASNTLGGLSSPSYSSGALTFRMTPDIDPSWLYVHCFHNFPARLTYRYVKCVLSFPGATEVKLSQVVLDQAVIPSAPLAPGLGVTPVEPAIWTETMGTAVNPQERPISRNITLQVEESGPAAPGKILGELDRLAREVGSTRPLALILEDAPSEFAMNKLFYGSLKPTSPFPIPAPEWGLWTVGFDFKEWGSVSRSLG